MKKSRPIFGISFVSVRASQLAEFISSEPVPFGQGARAIYTANIDHIIHIHENAEFRRAYDKAWAATVDGWPIVLFAKLLRGIELPRITGADLFPILADRLNPELHRLFLLVSSSETAAAIQQKFALRGFQCESVACEAPPIGFEKDSEYSRGLIAKVRNHSTTHFFLGVGTPKSEIWIDRNREELGDMYIASFGAGLEFFAETKPRAPLVIRKAGMEWAFRLASEPRRLARRYFFGAFRFVCLLRHI
jgi:N-acetylglucosaminyldiphosphoundecaprenol N-acetyl-beta-D-mannosaminyltransferase